MRRLSCLRPVFSLTCILDILVSATNRRTAQALSATAELLVSKNILRSAQRAGNLLLVHLDA